MVRLVQSDQAVTKVVPELVSRRGKVVRPEHPDQVP